MVWVRLLETFLKIFHLSGLRGRLHCLKGRLYFNEDGLCNSLTSTVEFLETKNLTRLSVMSVLTLKHVSK